MAMLINIDNGGTLTDIFATDGNSVYRTKTLTTPFDLSKCFFDGLTKISELIYGKPNLVALLSTAEHIRYSTTQGTNALVERKGPRLGLLLTGELDIEHMQRDEHERGLLTALVGTRSATLNLDVEPEVLEQTAVRTVNELASAGANRIVVAHGGSDRNAQETRLQRILLRRFPQHLLGAIPILCSHEVVEDEDDARRAWTALLNAFLHPGMEGFLYNAEHRMRQFKARNPLLIFRNDGHSARVAKTIAIKTYSSGPRGGMEGARALARHHGFNHLLSMDVGGTTTDIAEVRDGSVQLESRGRIEHIEIAYPLCNIHSAGVAGSSVIRVVDATIQVGPESVGSAPGPACFGLGGQEATITDAVLVTGLLDPKSFFGGELTIDIERARNAIRERIAEPLGLDVEAAADAVERAWIGKIADSLTAFANIGSDTTLAAFGGAGPLLTTAIAEQAGISRILIPGLAAVFSAYGLGFSDIAHEYEAPLDEARQTALDVCVKNLERRARRGMRAEGFAFEDCVVAKTLQISADAFDERIGLNGKLPNELPAGARLSVSMLVSKSIPQPHTRGHFGGKTTPATAHGTRSLLIEGETVAVPVYRVEDQPAGATASGAAVLEEAFFTCRIDPGWTFEVNDNQDILLLRA